MAGNILFIFEYSCLLSNLLLKLQVHISNYPSDLPKRFTGVLRYTLCPLSSYLALHTVRECGRFVPAAEAFSRVPNIAS